MSASFNRTHATDGRLGGGVVRAAARWAVSGAVVALLTIALMASQAEQQYPWFYAAWFLTVLVASALLGAFCALCSIPSR